MINENLLEKVADFNFWQKEQEVGITRKELAQVLKFVDDKEYTLIIAGIRRAGKTFLSRQILREKINQGTKPEQTLYVNFEDPILEPYLNTKYLSDLYESYRYRLNNKEFAYIVFDEIQNVPKWEKWVRIMLEKKDKKQIYLKELFEDIVIKDIIIKYKLRELDVKKLAVILINQFSCLTSARRLKIFLTEITGAEISPTTINNYLEYFSDTFLYLFLPIFSYKIKGVLQYPKKVYSIDNGFINALTLRFSDNIGRLYENIVAKTLNIL